jgi:hypothetical protein
MALGLFIVSFGCLPPSVFASPAAFSSDITAVQSGNSRHPVVLHVNDDRLASIERCQDLPAGLPIQA